MMSMSSNDHPQVSPDHGAPVDLPTPWIRQYDTNFMTYFYVNPSTNPPTSTWQHPSLPSGEAAPEQLDALNSTPAQGHAAHYLNSTSEDAPLPAAGQYPTASTGNAGTEGPDGDRSIAMAVGMHFAMGKIKEKVKESKQNQEGTGDGGSSAGGDKKHTGPIAMLGKKAGDLLGVNKPANNASTPGPTNNEGTHAPQVDLTSTGQYAQPSGRPPFMSSRGRGGGPMGAGRGAGAQRGRGGRGGRGGSRGMAGDHHEAVYGQ